MRKNKTQFVIFFLMINICLATLVGISFNTASEFDDEPWEAPMIKQKSPDNYEPSHVYYLHAGTLSGVPRVTDGSKVDMNLLQIVNGGIYSFYYPAQSKKPTTLKLTSKVQPFISLVLNSMVYSGKTFQASVGIDTNEDYDPHIPTTLEHRCEFQTYLTTGDRTDGTLEEEYYESYGTWLGGTPPTVITNGRLILEVTMTSPNGDQALLYCGYDYKISWLVLPFEHYELIPNAKINKSSQFQGFEELGKKKVWVGEKIIFDGSDSYDINDDQNGNEKIDPFEIDRLKYKWSWGDGSETGFEYNNKVSTHIYSSDDIPITFKYKEFEVKLFVQNRKGLIGWNSTLVRVYRGNHSPELLSLKINDIEQLGPKSNPLTTILDDRISVWFSAIAIDKDGDELTYYWDLNNDGEYDFIDYSNELSTIKYIFSEPEFNVGKHEIKLKVSENTLAQDTTASCFIYLERNVYPVAKIKAQCESENKYYWESIKVNLNEEIIFFANESFDPDNMPGFDIDDDKKTDYQLKYRWMFNKYDPTATSDWITEHEYSYKYISPGTYQYEVTLDVDDGANITTSEPFLVKINVRPRAKIKVDPESYNVYGNLEQNSPVYFNGEGSYDLNGDEILNYTWIIGTGDKAIRRYGKILPYEFMEPGEYMISLTVSDGELLSLPYKIQIEIPKPCKCELLEYKVEPLEAQTDDVITFSASANIKEDNHCGKIKYIWDFGDDTTYHSYENKTTHRYEKSGLYLITLTIEYGQDKYQSISSVIVTVKNRPPTAVIKNIKPVLIGEQVMLSGVESLDVDGEIIWYIWNFGDGSPDLWTNQSVVDHSWQKPGRYTIELTVQDDDGGVDTKQIEIEVKDESVTNGGLNFMVILIIIVFVAIIFAVILLLIRIWGSGSP